MPLSETIKSKDNPKIKLYRRLTSSKKDRSAYRLFTLEGSRLIFDAAGSGADIRQVFLTPKGVERYLSEARERFGEDFSVNIISEELGAYISATENTQGIFAVCGFGRDIAPDRLIKSGGRYAVLCRVQDPGNTGMIIRTADALGLDGVVLFESCDLYNPKTVRATMGSLFRIPVIRSIGEDALFTALGDAGVRSFAAVVGGDAVSVKDVGFSGGGAVFIGNEGSGLDGSITAKCTDRITIKMSGNTESLNAAMAAGIIMWELMRHG